VFTQSHPSDESFTRGVREGVEAKQGERCRGEADVLLYGNAANCFPRGGREETALCLMAAKEPW